MVSGAGGVDRLTSIPNGKNLTTPPGGFTLETHGPYQVTYLAPRFLYLYCMGLNKETHGPYQHGGGKNFPAVNGAPFDTCSMCGNLPVTFKNALPDGQTFVGLGQKNVFASEFGSSVYSSFESMSPTLAKEHWCGLRLISGASAPCAAR